MHDITITAKAGFNYPINDRGDTRNIPANWRGPVPFDVAKEQAKMGNLIDPPKDLLAEPKTEEPNADMVALLVSTVLPKISPEDWKKDPVPNLSPLKALVKEAGGQPSKLTAAERDAAVIQFKSDNPDLFKADPETGSGEGTGDGGAE